MWVHYCASWPWGIIIIIIYHRISGCQRLERQKILKDEFMEEQALQYRDKFIGIVEAAA
jgi:hypothetical protein